MNIAFLAIIFLIVAIAFGFIKGMNTGVVAMAFALIAAIAVGIKDKQLLSGFPVSMFLILFGTMFLFGIAEKTGAMHLLARKVIAMVGDKSWLLPWAIFVLALGISAMGAGPAPAIAIVALPAISLAIEMEVPPFLFGVMCAMGADCGAASPISTAGIVAQQLTEDFAWGALQPTYFINSIIGHVCVALGCYILLRGWKIKPKKKIHLSEVPNFNKNQIITLVGILVFIVLVATLKRNVGLIALIVGLVLILIDVGPTDKDIIKDLSWNTLLLICGVSVLMNIVVQTGGIDLMVEFLAKFMNQHTAKPVMALTAGIMSWFSTTTSVVMPTLIPTIPGILEKIGPVVNPVTLMSALTNGSFSAAISPLSAGGGIVLATYVQLTGCDENEQSKMFKDLFLIAVFCVLIMVAVAFTPLYR